MLEKFVHKRKLISLVFLGALLMFWLLYWIFGSGEDKNMLLILTPILPIIIYGFARFMFKIVRINAPMKFITFGVWFFFIMGALGIILNLIGFIKGFPNGLSPTLGACMGLIVAVLAEAKKINRCLFWQHAPIKNPNPAGFGFLLLLRQRQSGRKLSLSRVWYTIYRSSLRR